MIYIDYTGLFVIRDMASVVTFVIPVMYRISVGTSRICTHQQFNQLFQYLIRWKWTRPCWFVKTMHLCTSSKFFQRRIASTTERISSSFIANLVPHGFKIFPVNPNTWLWSSWSWAKIAAVPIVCASTITIKSFSKSGRTGRMLSQISSQMVVKETSCSSCHSHFCFFPRREEVVQPYAHSRTQISNIS